MIGSPVGDPAEFTVEAYDERVFPAMVEQVRFASETIDGVVTYKVILTVDNAEMALRPGMTATARILVAEIEDVLLVPNAALRFSPPGAAEPEESKGGGGIDRHDPAPSRGARSKPCRVAQEPLGAA